MGAPKVSPDGLKKAYWSDLTTRTIQAVLKIVARQEMTAAGKIIPDDEDLVIGAGRHLAAGSCLSSGGKVQRVIIRRPDVTYAALFTCSMS